MIFFHVKAICVGSCTVSEMSLLGYLFLLVVSDENLTGCLLNIFLCALYYKERCLFRITYMFQVTGTTMFSFIRKHFIQ